MWDAWRTPREVSRYLFPLTSGAFVGTYTKPSSHCGKIKAGSSQSRRTRAEGCLRGSWCVPPALLSCSTSKSSCKDMARLPAPSRPREHGSSFPCMPWSARSKPGSLTGIGHLAQVQQYPLSEDEVRMQRLHQRLVEAAAIPLPSTELPQSTNTESCRVLTTEDYGLLPPY